MSCFSLTTRHHVVTRNLLSRAKWAPLFSHSRLFSQPSDNGKEVDFGDYSIVLLPDTPFRSRRNQVPSTISRPSYERLGKQNSVQRNLSKSNIVQGTMEERKMRESCLLAKEALDYAGGLVREGITTDEIDLLVHKFIISHGAYPSPLNYEGFPKSICTSVNNIISHGIPNDRPLELGDIINIDITVFFNGYHGDTSRTFQVGNVDTKGRNLLQIASTALQVGISACGPGRSYRDIGASIHAFIHGYPNPLMSPSIGPSSSRLPIRRPQCDQVVYEICSSFSGHGIGLEFHMKPWIYHTKNEEPGTMEIGDCFTIEPIILQASPEERTGIWIWPDGWTTSTENGARGAVFEHTVLITENGVDILTA